MDGMNGMDLRFPFACFFRVHVWLTSICSAFRPLNRLEPSGEMGYSSPPPVFFRVEVEGAAR